MKQIYFLAIEAGGSALSVFPGELRIFDVGKFAQLLHGLIVLGEVVFAVAALVVDLRGKVLHVVA